MKIEKLIKKIKKVNSKNEIKHYIFIANDCLLTDCELTTLLEMLAHLFVELKEEGVKKENLQRILNFSYMTLDELNEELKNSTEEFLNKMMNRG